MKENTKKTESYVIPGQMYLEHNGQLLELGKAEIVTESKHKNSNFYMAFFDMIEQTPLKDIFELDFLIYLIKNMKSDNTISFVTDKELAEKFEVCRQTIASYKQKLVNAKIIKHGKNVIMVNPYYFYKGGANSKEKAIKKWNSIENKVKYTKSEAKEKKELEKWKKSNEDLMKEMKEE